MPRGESERFIAEALGPRRDEMVIATKGGLALGRRRPCPRRGRRPRSVANSKRACSRLDTDRIDIYYLHAPDKNVSDCRIGRRAEALLLGEGKTRAIGVSNCSVDQLEAFSAEMPDRRLPAALQHVAAGTSKRTSCPWCREHGVSVACYWPLMKGLLAGKLARDHVFDAKDSRRKYPMFQGEEWRKSHDMLDKLRPIAEECGKTLVQLVVNWTIHQPGMTAAICGAKRPEQIEETAGGAGWKLTR